MVVIDKTLCDKCGTCISVCPNNALTLNEVLSVNRNLCIDCGRCIKVCPFAAIDFIEPVKRDGGD